MGYNKIDYNNNFIREKYDRINFTMPKGGKEVLEAKAKEKGFNSVGEYLKDLIARDMAGGALRAKRIVKFFFICKNMVNNITPIYTLTATRRDKCIS